VAVETGRTWNEWIRLLDEAGGHEMTRKTIAAYLGKEYGLSSLWQEMVSIG